MCANDDASGLFAALWIKAGANLLFDRDYAGDVTALFVDGQAQHRARSCEKAPGLSRRDDDLAGDTVSPRSTKAHRTGYSSWVH